MRILTSLAVSGASALIPLLLLRGSEGWITPSSKSLFHLYPITPSSGGRARGSGTRRQDWLFIHPSPPLFLSSSSFPFPLHVSGALLALFDLKLYFFFFLFFFLIYSSFLCSSQTLYIYINCVLLSLLPRCFFFNFPLISSNSLVENRRSPVLQGQKVQCLLLMRCIIFNVAGHHNYFHYPQQPFSIPTRNALLFIIYHLRQYFKQQHLFCSSSCGPEDNFALKRHQLAIYTVCTVHLTSNTDTLELSMKVVVDVDP